MSASNRPMTTTVPIAAAALGLCLAGAAAGQPSGAPPSWPEPVPDGRLYGFMQVDRFESGFGDGPDTKRWDAQGWIGGDYHRLWLKTEGEGELNRTAESAEIQILYGQAIRPFWNLQAGLRHDWRPNPARSFAALGMQGLAPYWLEVDAALFLSEDGDVSARLELEYELLLTQRLILQPRLQLNAAEAVPEYGIGAGLGSTEAGLRLRYEIRRELAPYIGVSWTGLHGESADFTEAAGGDDVRLQWLIGLRAWY